MITCFLCRRAWPKDKSHHVERDYWVCGAPRFCHQYTNTAAAYRLLAHDRPRPTSSEYAQLAFRAP